MKRVMSLLLAGIVLLCSAVLAEASETDELLEQLAALLEQRESLYALRSGAYEALEAFGAQNDYPSLLNARLVCDEALQALQLIEHPALALSDEALLALLQTGVQTDTLEQEFQDASYMTAETELTMYDALLYTNIYQISLLDTIRDWLAISQERLALEIAYDGKMVNDLLLPMAEEPEVVAFWDAIPDRWPLIGDGLAPWESDQAVLLRDGKEILTGLDELQDAAAQVTGQDAYATERLAARVEAWDFEALQADSNPMASMPLMLPLPDGWLLPNDTHLYVSYEEGDALPDAMMMSTAAVTAEMFHAYEETLTALNIPLYGQEGSDEEGWRTVFTIGGEVLILNWRPDQTATVILDPRAISLEAYLYILCVML